MLTTFVKLRLIRSPAMSGSLVFGATHVAKILLRLVSSVILTRLLYPEAFGYMAIVTSAVLMISLSTDIGIKPFLIRYPEAPSETMLNVLWTLKVMRGLALLVIMLAFSGMLADFYGDEKIATLLQIVAFSSVITAICPLSLYWAEKEQRFSFVATVEFFAFLAQTVVVIAVTAIFKSYWCLAIGTLVNAAVILLVSMHMDNYRLPKLSIDWPHVKKIWTFIKWITFGSALFVAVMQADRFVIGKIFGSQVLGFYAIALTISEALNMMAQNIVTRIGFPTWAEAQKRGEGNKSFKEFSQVFIPIAGMASGALTFLGDDIVSILYDERYAIAGTLLAIMAIRTVLVSLLTASTNLLVVAGHSRAMFTANVIRLVWVAVGVMLVMGTGDIHLYALVFATMDLPAIIFYSLAARGYRGVFLLSVLYAAAGFSVGGLFGFLGSNILSVTVT